MVFRNCFRRDAPPKLGIYTLLAAAGVNVAGLPEFVADLPHYRDEPLARYLALHTSRTYQALQQRFDLQTSDRIAPRDSFLHRLASFHDLTLRWQLQKGSLTDLFGEKPRQERAIDFVRRHPSSALGLAALIVLQDRAGTDRDFHRRLADSWALLAKTPGLAYLGRYEQARWLLAAGDQAAASKHFRTLYEETFSKDLLPPVDAAFQEALRTDSNDGDPWAALMRQCARRLVAAKKRPAAVWLAWQAHLLDAQPLPEALLSVALSGVANDERLPVTLAAVQFLQQTRQYRQARKLLLALLEDEKLARSPALWRLAAEGSVGDLRDLGGPGRPDEAIACLEKALDLEFDYLPEVINLEHLRKDYGELLSHYTSLARAAVVAKTGPPRDLLAKVIRTADRWRALDPDPAAPCRAAADILRLLGKPDLAWEYLTTPIGRNPAESPPWAGLASDLAQQGNYALADRAYEAAFEADPGNAQLLWDRARNLKRAGRLAESRRIFRQLADTDWQPRYRWLREQARWQLEPKKD
jgi:tetratricopeptide (TPR) repeat protein